MTEMEWQIAEGSATAHVLDVSKPAPKRTGRKALCGRRPQRHNFPWFGLPVTDPGVRDSIRGYWCALCPDCDDALKEVSR